MKKRYWRVRGYDSLSPIFDKTVSVGHFSESQIQLLLQVLAAKRGLSDEEIVGALARRGTRISNDLLAVHKDPNQPTWMCGSDPWFTASVVGEEGKVIRPPENKLGRTFTTNRAAREPERGELVSRPPGEDAS